MLTSPALPPQRHLFGATFYFFSLSQSLCRTCTPQWQECCPFLWNWKRNNKLLNGRSTSSYNSCSSEPSGDLLFSSVNYLCGKLSPHPETWLSFYCIWQVQGDFQSHQIMLCFSTRPIIQSESLPGIRWEEEWGGKKWEHKGNDGVGVFAQFLCCIFGLYLTSSVGVKNKEEQFCQTGMSHGMMHASLFRWIQDFKHGVTKQVGTERRGRSARKRQL